MKGYWLLEFWVNSLQNTCIDLAQGLDYMNLKSFKSVFYYQLLQHNFCIGPSVLVWVLLILYLLSISLWVKIDCSLLIFICAGDHLIQNVTVSLKISVKATATFCTWWSLAQILLIKLHSILTHRDIDKSYIINMGHPWTLLYSSIGS
jgi:hypothetical protein